MMSLTFGLFTQVSGSGPLGPLVFVPKAKKIVICRKICAAQTLWFLQYSSVFIAYLEKTMYTPQGMD